MKQPAIAIIGAGHNGLTCACYLAQAGFKNIFIFERRDIVGGAAVTEEFYCDANGAFRNSTASYTVGLFPKKIQKDLNLKQHGLKIIPRTMSNFLPLDNDYLSFGGKLDDRFEIAKFSKKDAIAYNEYMAMLERVAGVFRQFMWDTPPTTKGLRNAFQFLKLSGRLNKLDVEHQREIIDLFTKSAVEIVDRYFESDPIKAVMCWDSIVGNYVSPYDKGTAYVQLHHVFGESTHGWGHAVGGMGSITQAMLREAESYGIDVRTGQEVTEVVVRNGVVKGIRIGTRKMFIPFEVVIGNCHPKTLYIDLIGDSHLEDDFVDRIKAYRSGSATFRVNVALDDLPIFKCHPESGDHLGAGILMMPSIKYMDKAYLDARTRGYSRFPAVEMLIPSVLDPTLAPYGKHVASLFCQHFDPNIEGRWNEIQVENAVNNIFRVCKQHITNWSDIVLGYDALSPTELERRIGLIGGDIFHGCLTFDQMYSNRPMLGYGNYRGPIKGLYMCGSGTHPGGGVTGIPGHNAAREIIKDQR